MLASLKNKLSRLSRRQRAVSTTAILVALTLVVMIALTILLDTPPPTYRSGEEIEGITANLSRSLPKDRPEVTFIDVSRQAGITFKHFSERRSSQLPEDMGSGAAWGDYDQDGWPDLFIVNIGRPLGDTVSIPVSSTLFRNNGDGTFEDRTRVAGLQTKIWGMAAAWADYNNDSHLDLIVSSYGHLLLFHNNGDGTFIERTQEAGMAEFEGFWAGVSWADFDNDGWLDLYVCGYVQYETPEESSTSLQYQTDVPASINPSSFPPERNLLFRNNGNGQFAEIAAKAGVANANGRSLSAAWCDFDEDGLIDLYVANDVSDNALYRNLGDGTFEEISLQALVADYRGAMGIAVGDWDGDQDMDLFITHWIAQENALFNNQRAQIYAKATRSGPVVQFMDEADRFGLGQLALDYIGWGTSFFDFDNDGALDLFVANGSTFQQKDKPWLIEPMRDQLFWNRGAQKGFFEISSVSGDYFSERRVGRGAAFADYDMDGDTDILVVNHDGNAALLRNDGGNRKNYLQVRVVGTRSNVSGIGTKLRLWTGSEVQIRQVGAQSSYLSQNSTVQHFGLASHSLVDSLEIQWPGGAVEKRFQLSINTLIEIREK